MKVLSAIVSFAKQALLKSLLLVVRFYQLFLSPLLGANCRFYPSCSHYCHEALVEHGIAKGLFLGLKRILRCHPGHAGGVDPVPKKSSSHG